MSQSGKLELTRGDSHLQGRLQDGQLDGPLRIKEAGRPQAQLGYSGGELHGPTTLYHPNGQVSAILPYLNGKLHGIAMFYAAQGALQRKVSYRQGWMHGEASNYYPDGTLAEVEHYCDGVQEGAYLRYHSNGQLASRSRYLKGRLLDDSQQFSNDGRPLDAAGKPMTRVRWWWKRWSEAGQV